jgi:hypothetical protein
MRVEDDRAPVPTTQHAREFGGEDQLGTARPHRLPYALDHHGDGDDEVLDACQHLAVDGGGF